VGWGDINTLSETGGGVGRGDMNTLSETGGGVGRGEMNSVTNSDVKQEVSSDTDMDRKSCYFCGAIYRTRRALRFHIARCPAKVVIPSSLYLSSFFFVLPSYLLTSTHRPTHPNPSAGRGRSVNPLTCPGTLDNLHNYEVSALHALLK
jgi:hypothetical protein